MNIPRELIYEDKRSLNDFCYRDEDSLNGQLYANGLIKIKDLKPGENGFRGRLLSVFNDAYYICTMAVRLINSDISLHYYKERVRIPSVVLPMVHFYLSRLDQEPEHIKTFLTVLETDIIANGWEDNLKILNEVEKKSKMKCSLSEFAFRDLSPELLDTIKWYEVTGKYKTDDIRRVLINIARNKEDYLLLLETILKYAKEYERNYNNELRCYDSIDEDGNWEFYEEKPIDLSNVFKYCEDLKAKYDELLNTGKLKRIDINLAVKSADVVEALQFFLNKGWFDDISANRSIYTEAWRNRLVEDFIASEFGNEIVEEWNKNKNRNRKMGTKSRTNRPQIRMQLVGALKKAGVFGKSKNNEIFAKIKASFIMDLKFNSFTEYMRRGNKYSEWMRQYVSLAKAENPTETSN